jgi:hydroxymethylglutaryl-CoA lyase
MHSSREAAALGRAARDVTVREVGLRDGLQSVKKILPTEVKTEWIDRELATGMREIEVSSFVPQKVIPQFFDAAEVVAHALKQPGLTVHVLVPNLKGAERAVEHKAHQINFVLSASEAHNRNNVRRSIEESLADLERIAALVKGLPPERRPRLCGGLATAFGCTLQGDVDEGHVLKLVERLMAIGVDDIALADTVGYANPAAIRRVFTAAAKIAGRVPLAGHFHDTRGLGLANVVAALEAGVRTFDASIGGFGGCPFAPGATGNITLEDLVYMLESMGLRTGVDVAKLVALRAWVKEQLPDDPFAGAIAKAGLAKNYHPATQPAA